MLDFSDCTRTGIFKFISRCAYITITYLFSLFRENAKISISNRRSLKASPLNKPFFVWMFKKIEAVLSVLSLAAFRSIFSFWHSIRFYIKNKNEFIHYKSGRSLFLPKTRICQKLLQS